LIKTRIKIVETNRNQGLIPYLEKIVLTRTKMSEYFRGVSILREDAEHFARLNYGVTWGYNPRLDMCVDHRREAVNTRLDLVDNDTLVYTTDKLTNDMDTNVYRDPTLGTGVGPTGSNRFRGNLTPVSQQTDVAVGTDPASSKPEGVWTTVQTRPASINKDKAYNVNTNLEKKVRVVKLKI